MISHVLLIIALSLSAVYSDPEVKLCHLHPIHGYQEVLRTVQGAKNDLRHYASDCVLTTPTPDPQFTSRMCSGGHCPCQGSYTLCDDTTNCCPDTECTYASFDGIVCLPCVPHLEYCTPTNSRCCLETDTCNDDGTGTFTTVCRDGPDPSICVQFSEECDPDATKPCCTLDYDGQPLRCTNTLFGHFCFGCVQTGGACGPDIDLFKGCCNELDDCIANPSAPGEYYCSPSTATSCLARNQECDDESDCCDDFCQTQPGHGDTKFCSYCSLHECETDEECCTGSCIEDICRAVPW